MKVKTIASATTKHLTMVGKTVSVSSSTGKWIGVVKRLADGLLKVSPALMREGQLLVDWSTEETVHPVLAEAFSGVHVEGCKMKAWDEQTNLRHNAKRSTVTDKDGVVLDYKDVTINGYLSTFENYTARDRDGDYVKAQAFDKSISRFSNNPVMLLDHVNDIDHLAGSFTQLQKDGNGLAVVGKVSNAPELRKVRFLVAENHLKTLSMGGLFLYGGDGKSIEEVDLWEGSLVPVPANPDARFSVRSFDAVVSAKGLRRHMASHKELRGV